tara:strand:- start:236 stop:991 length:756 start_codon:yes stop_codon:yes gene_type:complete
MKLTYKGKTAIVTGACGGMGFETTKKLLKNNITTLMLDIKIPPKSFLKDNYKVIFKKVDITNYKKLKSIINDFYKKNKSIDYLINTTGVLWFNKDISSVKVDFSIWDKVYEINLKTMVYLSKIVIPKMQKNKFGSMVHISSVDALSGDDKPQDAYGSSKAAMIRLSKSLAIQYASKNIRSNIILPGPVNTAMQKRWKKKPSSKKNLEKTIPLKKVGEPDDIANGIMFLLSDQSQYITGTEIVIDGGITAKP